MLINYIMLFYYLFFQKILQLAFVVVVILMVVVCIACCYCVLNILQIHFIVLYSSVYLCFCRDIITKNVHYHYVSVEKT